MKKKFLLIIVVIAGLFIKFEVSAFHWNTNDYNAVIVDDSDLNYYEIALFYNEVNSFISLQKSMLWDSKEVLPYTAKAGDLLKVYDFGTSGNDYYLIADIYTYSSGFLSYNDLINNSSDVRYRLVDYNDTYYYLMSDINNIYKINIVDVWLKESNEWAFNDFTLFVPIQIGNTYIFLGPSLNTFEPVAGPAFSYEFGHQAGLEIADSELKYSYLEGYKSGIADKEIAVNNAVNNEKNRLERQFEIDLLAEKERSFNNGYDLGFNDALATDWDSMTWLSKVIIFIGTLFSFEFIPGVKIGYVALIPIALATTRYVLGLLKGRV